jgi:hypothetical protein
MYLYPHPSASFLKGGWNLGQGNDKSESSCDFIKCSQPMMGLSLSFQSTGPSRAIEEVKNSAGPWQFYKEEF